MEELEMEKKVWLKQRSVLVGNLGAIVKTAKVEIGRKDAEISKCDVVLVYKF